MVDVSVIIVNYRVKYFLEQTLRSVFQALEGLNGEVIVIDNASGDDSIAYSREKYGDRAVFIENKENVGFARANNQGIMFAKGEFTLILNPDTVITRDTIVRNLEWMRSHEDCGATGVRMVDGNGVFLPESKRSFPTPWVAFCKIFGLSKLFPRSPLFAKYHLRYLSDVEPHKVDILSGAYMMCRTSVLQQMGGLDEDFFIYGEDIDLSYRFTKAGYNNYYLPYNIIHYKGESTRKDSMRYVRIFYEAMLLFYRKHFPRYSAIAYPIIKAGVLVRASLAMFNRLGKRLFGRKNVKESTKPWVILSDHPDEIAQNCSIDKYSTDMALAHNARILIDDGCFSYDELVSTIVANSDKGREFHIYARRNGKIISPKMNQQ
ncbi:MAG: glycosyltransferase family 2 protein [Bacteroidales bacterium]|nr:glycosyltransferase family 2 protein [Candidatus Sodaliphilus aphodohippi]